MRKRKRTPHYIASNRPLERLEPGPPRGGTPRSLYEGPRFDIQYKSPLTRLPVPEDLGSRPTV
jgi:hypothetical protein